MKSQMLFKSDGLKSKFSFWGQVVFSTVVFGLFPSLWLLGKAASARHLLNPILNYAFLFLAAVVGGYGFMLLLGEILKGKSMLGFAITPNEIEIQLLNNRKRKFPIGSIKKVSCSKVPLSRNGFGWFLFVTTSGKEYLVPSKNFDQAYAVLSALRMPIRRTSWAQVVLFALVASYVIALVFPALMTIVILFNLAALAYLILSRKGVHFHVMTPDAESAIFCVLGFGFLMSVSSVALSAKDRELENNLRIISKMEDLSQMQSACDSTANQYSDTSRAVKQYISQACSTNVYLLSQRTQSLKAEAMSWLEKEYSAQPERSTAEMIVCLKAEVQGLSAAKEFASQFKVKIANTQLEKIGHCRPLRDVASSKGK